MGIVRTSSVTGRYDENVITQEIAVGGGTKTLDYG